MNSAYFNDFERNHVLNKMDDLENQLNEEQMKEDDKRDKEREFELLYARMIAGLKLNTGYRIF